MWFFFKKWPDKTGGPGEVIHHKYYKYLKKVAHQSHLGRQKIGLVSGRLACTSNKTEILNKIRM